jgi:hypothetical protein
VSVQTNKPSNIYQPNKKYLKNHIGTETIHNKSCFEQIENININNSLEHSTLFDKNKERNHNRRTHRDKN